MNMNEIDRIGPSMSTMSAMTHAKLISENRCYCGTGGISSVSGCIGFHPAFMDSATSAIYLSRFANGQIAPFHILDGLPDELVLARTSNGHVAAAKSSILAGFVHAGRFYTRDEAAAYVGAHCSFEEESA